MAISLAKDWVVAADGQLEVQNLTALPTQVDLTVEGWNGRIDGNATEQSLVDSLSLHIEAETNAAMAQITFDGPPLVGAFGAVIAVIFAIMSFAGGGSGFGVFLLLVAAGLGAWAGYRYSQLAPRREHVRQLGEQRKANGAAQVRGAIAEVLDWRTAWEQEVDRATSLRAYMNALAQDSFVESGPGWLREVAV